MTRRKTRHAQARGRRLTGGRGPDVPSSDPEHGKRSLSTSFLLPLAAVLAGVARSARSSGWGSAGRQSTDQTVVGPAVPNGASRQRHDEGSRPPASRSEGVRDVPLTRRPCPGREGAPEARPLSRPRLFPSQPGPVAFRAWK